MSTPPRSPVRAVAPATPTALSPAKSPSLRPNSTSPSGQAATSPAKAASPILAPLADLVLGLEGENISEAQLASSLEEAQEAAKRVLEQLDMEKRLLDEQLIVDIGHAQSQKEILEELKMAAPGCVETESIERHADRTQVEYQPGATSPLLVKSNRRAGSPEEMSELGDRSLDRSANISKMRGELDDVNLQLREAHKELEDAYKQLDEARAEQLQGLERERVLADQHAELRAEVQRLGGGQARYSALLQLLALPGGAARLTFRVGRVKIARGGGEGDEFEDVEVVLRVERVTLRQQDGVLCHVARKDAGFGASLAQDEREVLLRTEAVCVTLGSEEPQSRDAISVPGLLAAWSSSRPGMPDA